MADAVGTLKIMVTGSAGGFVKAMKSMRKPIKGVNSAVKKLGKTIKVMAHTSLWPLKKLRGAFDKLWASIRGVLRIMGGPLGRIGWFGGLGATGAGVLGVSFALKASAEYEQAAISLEVMLGSAKKAKTLMQDLLQFAAKTPLRFPDLLASAKQLVAFGISADQILPSLKALGNVATALNLSITDMAWLFGTTKTEGRLMGRDLRQFTMRGIPMIRELAKVLGVAESEIKGLVSEGKIGFPHVQQAFINMTKAGGDFHGLLGRLSQSMGGLWTTMMDTFHIFMIELGDVMGKEFGIKDMMRRIIGALQNARPEMIRLAMDVLRPLWGLVKGIGRVMLAAINIAVDMLVKFSGLLDKLTSGESWSELFFGKKGGTAATKTAQAATGGRGLKATAGAIGIGIANELKKASSFMGRAGTATSGFFGGAWKAIKNELQGFAKIVAKTGGFGALGVATHHILSAREAARQRSEEWFAQRGMGGAAGSGMAGGFDWGEVKDAFAYFGRIGRKLSPQMGTYGTEPEKSAVTLKQYFEPILEGFKGLGEAFMAIGPTGPLTNAQKIKTAMQDVGGFASEIADAIKALRDALMNAPADFESSLGEIGKIIVDEWAQGTKEIAKATARQAPRMGGVPALEYGTAAAQRAIMRSGAMSRREKVFQDMRNRLILIHKEEQKQARLAREAAVNSLLPVVIM